MTLLELFLDVQAELILLERGEVGACGAVRGLRPRHSSMVSPRMTLLE